MESLAIKYRPHSFDEVVEQSATKVILQQQLESGEIKNAYLFVGSAGTGKTTCARIFANEINKGKGSPIELDAASNNSVDDVREIIQQSKTTSIDSEYKVFIMDEVHALSNSAWQAMLKVLEEPPKKSIFILCTTDPQRIPKTILSRVQRYDFQRISQKGIAQRLVNILKQENYQGDNGKVLDEAVTYLAKIANGGMRDALTMLDKCLAYSTELTMDNVLKALGIANYTYMMNLLYGRVYQDSQQELEVINQVYMSGCDMKQFIKDFTNFVLDFCKYSIGVSASFYSCPNTDDIMKCFEECNSELDDPTTILTSLVKLQSDIKWDTNPKARIEVWCITGE